MNSTIQGYINNLKTSKANIKTSIGNKGVSVSDDLKLDAYANKVAEISAASETAGYNAVSKTLLNYLLDKFFTDRKASISSNTAFRVCRFNILKSDVPNYYINGLYSGSSRVNFPIIFVKAGGNGEYGCFATMNLNAAMTTKISASINGGAAPNVTKPYWMNPLILGPYDEYNDIAVYVYLPKLSISGSTSVSNLSTSNAKLQLTSKTDGSTKTITPAWVTDYSGANALSDIELIIENINTINNALITESTPRYACYAPFTEVVTDIVPTYVNVIYNGTVYKDGTLTLPTVAYNVGSSNDGHVYTVTVRNDTSAAATINATNCRISNSASSWGAASTSVTVNAGNTSSVYIYVPASRDSAVTVSLSINNETRVSFTQNGTPSNYTVDGSSIADLSNNAVAKTYSVSADAGTKSVSVAKNTAYTTSLSYSGTGATGITPTSIGTGSQNVSVSLQYSANTGFARTFYYTLTHNSKTVKLQVNQNAMSDFFITDGSNLSTCTKYKAVGTSTAWNNKTISANSTPSIPFNIYNSNSGNYRYMKLAYRVGSGSWTTISSTTASTIIGFNNNSHYIAITSNPSITTFISNTLVIHNTNNDTSKQIEYIMYATMNASGASYSSNDLVLMRIIQSAAQEVVVVPTAETYKLKYKYVNDGAVVNPSTPTIERRYDGDFTNIHITKDTLESNNTYKIIVDSAVSMRLTDSTGVPITWPWNGISATINGSNTNLIPANTGTNYSTIVFTGLSNDTYTTKNIPDICMTVTDDEYYANRLLNFVTFTSEPKAIYGYRESIKFTSSGSVDTLYADSQTINIPLYEDTTQTISEIYRTVKIENNTLNPINIYQRALLNNGSMPETGNIVTTITSGKSYTLSISVTDANSLGVNYYFTNTSFSSFGFVDFAFLHYEAAPYAETINLMMFQKTPALQRMEGSSMIQEFPVYPWVPTSQLINGNRVFRSFSRGSASSLAQCCLHFDHISRDGLTMNVRCNVEGGDYDTMLIGKITHDPTDMSARFVDNTETIYGEKPYTRKNDGTWQQITIPDNAPLEYTPSYWEYEEPDADDGSSNVWLPNVLFELLPADRDLVFIAYKKDNRIDTGDDCGEFYVSGYNPQVYLLDEIRLRLSEEVWNNNIHNAQAEFKYIFSQHQPFAYLEDYTSNSYTKEGLIHAYDDFWTGGGIELNKVVELSDTEKATTGIVASSSTSIYASALGVDFGSTIETDTICAVSIGIKLTTSGNPITWPVKYQLLDDLDKQPIALESGQSFHYTLVAPYCAQYQCHVFTLLYPYEWNLTEYAHEERNIILEITIPKINF